MQDDATVSAADIARLAGVGRAAVSNWRRRYPDFPQPVGGTPTSPVFALSQIETWLRGQGKLRELPPEERAWQRLRAEAGDDLRLAEVLADAGEALLEKLGAGPAAPHGGPHRPARTAAADVLAELAAERGATEAFEFLFARYRETQTRRASAIPSEVVDLMMALAGDAATILDPACGAGDLLLAALDGPAATGGHAASGARGATDDRDAVDGRAAVDDRGVLDGPAAADDRAGRNDRAPVDDRAALDAAGVKSRAGRITRGGRRLLGQDALADSARLAAVRLALRGGHATIRIGDSLLGDAFPGALVDVVLCDPPFHERIWRHEELAADPRWEYGLPPRLEPELAWVQHALAHLAPRGRALVLMPAVAAGRRSGRRIRAQLLRRGALRAVIATPSGHHLWVLCRPEGATPATVLMVDGADPEPAAAAWRAHGNDPEHDEPGVSRAVPIIDLLDDEVDLTPARHLSPAGAERSAERFTDTRDRLAASVGGLGALLPEARPAEAAAEPRSVPVAELARIGDLSIHQATPRREAAGDGEAAEPMLTVDDLVEDRPPSGRGLPGDPRATPVRAGDVVVAVVARRFVARVARDGGALLGPHLTLLRVDPGRLDPHFLAGVVRSSANGRLSAAAPTGGTGRADVRRAQVPRLPIEQQRRHGTAFRRMAEFESALRSTAELGAELAQLLADGVAGGALAPGPDGGPPPVGR